MLLCLLRPDGPCPYPDPTLGVTDSLRDGVGMCCLRDHTRSRARARAIQRIGHLLLSHPHLTVKITVALTATLFL
jgi:hypothetical protein